VVAVMPGLPRLSLRPVMNRLQGGARLPGDV